VLIFGSLERVDRMRVDGRQPGELRPVEIIPNYVQYPEGSVLISTGDTKVLCNASIQDGVPNWMRTQKLAGGWVTAEYAMLPRATHQRTPRETFKLRGRTQEIRRLIGRSLRAAFDLASLGPRTCIVDCDVIQADGGTRTAAVTGGYVALAIAIKELILNDDIAPNVIKKPVAAVSAGIVDDIPLLDLCYQEDASAEVDINVIMNSSGEFIEIQGTAEGQAFNRSSLDEMLDLAKIGIEALLDAQQEVIKSIK
jgi:ribonuclease PH